MDVVIEYNDTYHHPQTEQLCLLTLELRVVLTAGREGGREGEGGEGREGGGEGGRKEREGGGREGGRVVRELQKEKGVT